MTKSTLVSREKFLQVLQMVSPGLSPKDVIEQSSCFVFSEGQVITFNDRVACRAPSGLPEEITGSLPAEKLLEILQKRQDDDIFVEQQSAGLLIKQKGWKSFHNMERDIQLPIKEIPVPDEWHKLDDSFCDAVNMVAKCVSTDETKAFLTCVHIHPKWVEACDNTQACRWKIPSPLSEPILIPGTSLSPMTSMGVGEIALTDRWAHFRNAAGLIYSCRTHADEYVSLKGVFTLQDGVKTALPKRLAEAAERATVFAKEETSGTRVFVDLKSGKLKLRGEGLSGWYEETKKIDYDGAPLKFYINPAVLSDLVKHNECVIAADKMMVDGGSYKYVTVLMQPETSDEPQEEAVEA